MNELEWGVRHIDQDGTDYGVIAAASEAIARETVKSCAEHGTPCELVAREIGPWDAVPFDVLAEF